MSYNFRKLYALQFNQWSKRIFVEEKLWPLSFDKLENDLTEEEMYLRNQKVIDDYMKRHSN